MKEFTSLYNNLHFPNFKNVPPCIVILLKDVVNKITIDNDSLISYDDTNSKDNDEDIKNIALLIENRRQTNQTPTIDQISPGYVNNLKNDLDSLESSEGRDIPINWMELPTCTVCLRRLQCSASGVDGGNDIPVSMWFNGNTNRCQACKVYGEGNESDGNASGKSINQVWYYK